MKITIAAHTVLYNNPSNPPAFARVYCNELFVNEDGQTVFAGSIEGSNYVKQVAVTNSASGAEIAAFNGANQIDSSVDENGVTESTYALTLHDSAGRHLVTLYETLRIPQTPTSTTWADIVLFNNAHPQPPRYEFYDTLQTNALINGLQTSMEGEIADAISGSVLLTGNQTVGGIKTFTSSPIVPAPTTDLQVATKKYVDDNAGGQGSIFCDASKLQHIDIGGLYRPGIEYSHFFWQFTVKPYISGTNWLGYFFSDNHGGDHVLLFGAQMNSDGNYIITGNIFDGTTLHSFSTMETFRGDEWAMPAIGWDGSDLMIWNKGWLVHVQPYTSGRMQPGGNNFCVQLMGSDHNNAWGNIFEAVGYEGFGRCRWTTDYSPEYVTRPLGALGPTTRDVPQFCMNFSTNQALYQDTSGGFEGNLHHGLPAAQLSVQGSGGAGPSFNNFDLPTFEIGLPDFRGPARTAPVEPAGALVWDPFAREDVSPLSFDFTSTYNPPSTLGETQGGSYGPLPWIGGGVFPYNCGGILNGMATMGYSGSSITITPPVTLADADLRVDRIPSTFCYTSLYFRVKDDNDRYAVWGSDTSLTLERWEGGVHSTVPITVSSGWKTLRTVVNGTSITIYTGTATEGVFTSVYTGTITNVAGTKKYGLYNCQTFIKSVYRAGRFLIKAG